MNMTQARISQLFTVPLCPSIPRNTTCAHDRCDGALVDLKTRVFVNIWRHLGSTAVSTWCGQGRGAAKAEERRTSPSRPNLDMSIVPIACVVVTGILRCPQRAVGRLCQNGR
jgi:hypothetical protein